MDERQDNGTVIMQGEKVAKVDDLKYQGSTVHSLLCRVRKRSEEKCTGGMEWLELETVAPKKRQEAEMDVA